MKSLYEQDAANEILARMEKLTPQSTAQWGEMTVSQMIAHCSNALDMAMGVIHPQRIFIGRIIGGIFKSKFFDDSPPGKNSPTSVELKVTDGRDFHVEKERLIALIKKFNTRGEKGCTESPHPFFGKLGPDQWSKGMYKHLDHHFSQFGA